MTLPDESFSTDPLDRAHRHIGRIVGMGMGVEWLDDAVSAEIRREQLEHLAFAQTWAAVSAADDLRRIADTLGRLLPE